MPHKDLLFLLPRPSVSLSHPTGTPLPLPNTYGAPRGIQPRSLAGRRVPASSPVSGLARQGAQRLPQRIHQTPLGAPSPLESSPEVLAALIEVETAPVSGWGEGRGGRGAPPVSPARGGQRAAAPRQAQEEGAPLAFCRAPNRMSHCWRKQLEIHREPTASGTGLGRGGGCCRLRPRVTLGRDALRLGSPPRAGWG